MNTVPDVEEALSGAAAGKSGRLLGAAAIILAPLSAGVGFLGGARPAVGASWGIRWPGTRIFLRLGALLGYGACNPSGATPNGRQGTW